MKHRNENFKIGKIGQIALTTLYSLAVMLVLTLILSALSLLGKNPLSTLGVMTIVIIAGSGAICGVSLSWVFKKDGMQMTALSSLLLSLIILAVGLILGGGKISLKLPLNILIYVLCSIISAYLARPRGKKRRFS